MDRQKETNMKYIVTVRGRLKGEGGEAQRNHDAIVAKVSPMGKSMGNVSHQAYLNSQDAGEFFAIDVWDNMESIQKLYSDPNLAAEFATMFAEPPEVTVWADSGWFQF
jgi:quinol monooxygenase YgiN